MGNASHITVPADAEATMYSVNLYDMSYRLTLGHNTLNSISYAYEQILIDMPTCKSK